MLSTPLDAFIFVSILASLIFFAAIYSRSPIIGSFSGLLLIFAGFYGLIYGLTPIQQPISTGMCFTVIGIGLYFFLSAIVDYIGR